MSDKMVLRSVCALALLATGIMATTVQADTVNIDRVPVGNAGNPADTTGYGAVAYTYSIGKYDVTTGQYTAFLNAVATTGDPYGLYNPGMGTGAGLGFPFGITQTAASGSYTYAVNGPANMPAFDISWGDAARFCNWLQNGQPTGGTEGTGTTETGAYTLNGATSNGALMAVTRNAGATYFLPTVNEWYKAAYYDPALNGGAGGYWTYPTKNNAEPSNLLSVSGTNNANYYNNGYTDPTNYLTPVGNFNMSPSAYGTYDQGGDVWQWSETAYDSSNRNWLGGSFAEILPDSAMFLKSSSAGSIGVVPTDGEGEIGFRIASTASVPEPGSIALLLVGAVALGIWKLRRTGSRNRGGD